MTDVHGEPQQGGYLPAEIWHAYMAAVTEGQTCQEFPEPKEPAIYKPFYGKFASTGQSQAGTEAENESGAKKPHKKAHQETGNTEAEHEHAIQEPQKVVPAPPPPVAPSGGVGAN